MEIVFYIFFPMARKVGNRLYQLCFKQMVAEEAIAHGGLKEKNKKDKIGLNVGPSLQYPMCRQVFSSTAV
jgi:hypothetical protein